MLSIKIRNKIQRFSLFFCVSYLPIFIISIKLSIITLSKFYVFCTLKKNLIYFNAEFYIKNFNTRKFLMFIFSLTIDFDLTFWPSHWLSSSNHPFFTQKLFHCTPSVPNILHKREKYIFFKKVDNSNKWRENELCGRI